MRNASHCTRAVIRLPCDFSRKSLHVHAEYLHGGGWGCARMTVARQVAQSAIVIGGSRGCKISDLSPPGWRRGAGPAAAAPARADALPCVVILPTHNVNKALCAPSTACGSFDWKHITTTSGAFGFADCAIADSSARLRATRSSDSHSAVAAFASNLLEHDERSEQRRSERIGRFGPLVRQHATESVLSKRCSTLGLAATS